MFLKRWAEGEALGEDGDILSRSLEHDGEHPTLMPMSIHSAEEGDHVHRLLLQKNERIQHPVKITHGNYKEFRPLVNEVCVHLRIFNFGALKIW